MFRFRNRQNRSLSVGGSCDTRLADEPHVCFEWRDFSLKAVLAMMANANGFLAVTPDGSYVVMVVFVRPLCSLQVKKWHPNASMVYL
jgi:hypothetical protein